MDGVPESVAVIPLAGVKKPLGYRVPPEMADRVAVGSLVRIPIQRRSELGIVTALEAPGDFPFDRLKFLHQVAQPFPVLTPDLIRLAEWMAVYYSVGFEAVLEAMIPAAVRKGMKPKEKRFVRLVAALDDDGLAALERRAPRQAEVYRFLAAQALVKEVPRETLLKRMKVSAAVLDSMVEKGLIDDARHAERRLAYDDEWGDAERVEGSETAHILTDEQRAAADGLLAALGPRTFATHLVHGVTGSGKTEVYLAVLEEVMKAGGGAVFLVPEVALAPQTVGRLRARLEAASGGRTVVWHSHLSDGERFDAWHALATGEARIVVGARSAVFAPVPDLRLIVVDEEHEPAYKQEETPRYHGRDVAVYRAHLAKALCVLGSATPSLETVRNAQTGKYTIHRLTKRVDDRPLPMMHIVDMKRELAHNRAPTIFSRTLIEKIHARLDKGEQCILFINRRGYDASLKCPDCGYVAMCDHCDLSLTHHRAEHILRCHMCGHEEYVPRKCPQCGSPKIVYRGSGTQKVEDIAQKLFPKAKIVRLDADTMRKKNLFRAVLGDFRRGKIDILVGTQIIGKGLDFPNVTLVGLMDADLSLHLPDFRAAERTFQILVQVSGRSGRGDEAGEVVVQTFIPYSDALQAARRGDFDGFAEGELAQRKDYGYPPFRHLVHHLFRSKSLEKVKFYAEQWTKTVEKELVPAVPLELRGPAPCPIERIKDHYRYQLWYFTPSASRLMPRLNALRAKFAWDREVIEVVDVDAVNLI
ncbi:MAG: primosomal protein N' [Opitutales bacterium]|nr:primosomal protein N' [Opitutales bacterium]